MPPSIHPVSQRVPQWQSLRHWQRGQRPAAALRNWLLDDGSLTAKLIHVSHGHFHVDVLRQRIARPGLSERRCLGMPHQALALIRDVVLCGHNRPWVFARSVLPLASLTGTLRHLRKQDARPLGAFLFSQPQLQRSPIAVSRLTRQHDYVPVELHSDGPLWGRRSVFSLNGKPLLVSEVFLQDFVARLD